MVSPNLEEDPQRRETQGDGRSLIHFVIDYQRAAVQFHQGFRQRQAKSGSLVAAGHDVFHLSKGLQHLPDILGGDTDAAVGDLDDDRAFITGAGDDGDPPAFGDELGGVGKQVEKDLLDLCFIGEKPRQAIGAFVCRRSRAFWLSYSFSRSCPPRQEPPLAMLKRIALLGPLLVLAAAAGAAEMPCVPAGRWLAPATASLLAQDSLIAAMARRPVVLLGETHTSAEDHRWQLHTIAALYGRNPDMVLGFEAFPRRAQPVLDDWTRGAIGEREFLAKSRWNEVWRFDPALYLPLFHFARLNRLPMVALNVGKGLISKVGKDGWQAVPENEREGVGNPAAAGEDYINSLARVFAEHEKTQSGKLPGHDDPQFRRFVEAQLTWDRAMGEKLAEARVGGRPLVIGIIGRGHLEYGGGVPHQLADLGIEDAAVLLPWHAGRACADLSTTGGTKIGDAVFGLAAAPAETPKPKLGVFITTGEGGVRVNKVLDDSIAAKAGLAEGDLIAAAAGTAVGKSALLVSIIRRQAPGTWLPLRVKRGGETIHIFAKFPPLP